jgi:hypothetical protein
MNQQPTALTVRGLRRRFARLRLALAALRNAVCAWATSAAPALVFFLAGAAVGLGSGLGRPLAGIVAIPTCALIAPVHKLLGLAVDVTFPDRLDRRGAATPARVGVIAIATAAAVTLAWSDAPFGTAAMLGAADVALVLTALLATYWISARLLA